MPETTEPSVRDQSLGAPAAMAAECNLQRSSSATEIEQMCVCLCAEEDMVCRLCVHASVYTLMILNVTWTGGIPATGLLLDLHT